ncbi:MAG: hypothetical protein OEZ48_01555 [Candidatus Bathyarchaeota archaeon]|nr:hypothetical protein [Candidatus Bathyarchaeota archaeon]MDH5686546.1 hypothetical protein [Candidatus Bathyarchaeota archaeon]
MVQKQLPLPVGIILFLVGIGLTFYNTTSEVWHIGEGTDIFDDKTWVIRDQSIGFATPWSYDLGTLPGGTRLWSRFNVTTVETRVSVERPGLTRHSIIDVDTGDVLVTTDSKPAFSQAFFTATRTSHYKYTIQSIRGTPLPGWTLDPTPVDFHVCIQAYELVAVYPYRLVGVPVLIAGIALAAYSKIKK